MSQNAAGKDTQVKIAEFEHTQQQLVNQLSKLGFGNESRENWTSIGSLIAKLPFKSRFVSIARFKQFDFAESHKQGKPVWLSARYAAWIVPPIGTGAVQCIDLGEADRIDKAVEQVRRHLTDSATQFGVRNEAELESELKTSLGELSKLVCQPLRPHLTEASELIVSPDGALWTVPWELMLTKDDKYLVESKRVRYVMSGRELVNRIPPRSVVGAPVIFADPDYDLNPTQLLATKSADRFVLRSRDSVRFPPLSYSAAEAAAIKPSLDSYLKQEAKTLLRTDAQEAAFKNLHRPRMLVMSTHGYFETDKRITNPLLRCGLALAGCNNRKVATKSGKEDGILTGLEIVGTDLRGTELVVLSACETGLGDITSGEGVAGLRQAFQLAGAESVISSLWQVEDGETARLMKLFFENLAAGKSKSEALRQAQLTRIAARRARHGAAHPFFWAAFTLTGQD